MPPSGHEWQKHCKGVSEETTTGVLKSAIGRKSIQDSWMMSVSKWFADEKEDTGLQTAENTKFFRHRIFDQIFQQMKARS